MSQPSNMPRPVEARGAEVATAEVGATGTPIFSGFLRELGEYNAQLTWPAAYLVYEQMRRSDAQVAATLWASKLPIRGGEWAVVAPDDASPVELEATEFIEQELFESIDFDAMLENALLMFDFGAALHEAVWKIDGNHVRIAKLAPRLPLTFYRWLCKPGTDELAVIEQLGYRAGQYVRTELPVAKCTLFTFRQEGANFTGRSLLREMYQHWYIKAGLYRVDAIACERNGMGVPVITMGPGPKAQDVEAALGWVQQLVAHERTGLVLPPGWLFALEGVKGNLRDPKESILHHNTLIAVAGLAQFMMMGQGSHGGGNRSLGETMSDFFFMELQATANQIGQRISDTTIKQLVDYNFPGVERYPQLVPQQIMALKFESVVEALAKLGQAQMVTEDPDLEDWLRKKIGAPNKPVGARVADLTRRRGGEVGKVAATDVTCGARREQIIWKGGRAMRLRAADAAVGPKLRREPRGAEKYLALSEIVGALDKGRNDVAAALRGARARVQSEIVHRLVDTPVRNMHRVSIAPDEKLIGEVEGLLHGVAEFGRAQVGQERDRQRAGKAPADAATIRMAAGKRARDDAVGLYADAVVSEFQNGLTARATNIALDKQRAGGLGKGELINAIGADLDEQSDKWIDGVASKGTNEAFAEGRADGYEENKDDISGVIYSALLDVNTCEQCAGADGEEGATPEDVPDVPNPDCDGGDKCRCVHVFVFADEVKGAA